MPDLDVVMKSLRRCSDMTICPDDCSYRKYAPDCVEKLHKDAIVLLKEQNELLKQQAELLKEQEAEIKRLKGELHGFGDLFHMLSEKTKEVMAEQPNIVRCKDCKYGRENSLGQIQCMVYMGDNDIHEQEWFCADGVAKDINVPDKEGR